MACRAEDIINYKDDIENLEKASTFAQKVIDESIEIGTALTDLSSEYSSAVNASEELVAQFHKLDENAESNARTMKAQIEETLETVKEWLKQAEIEEASCEIHHLNLG